MISVRKLNTADLFEFMRMVKRTGVKDELKKVAKAMPKKEKQAKLALMENEEAEKPAILQEKPSQAEVGIDLAFSVMEIFSNRNAEDEIYKFIARPFQCTPEEVAENDLMDTIEKLKEVADVKKWTSFFKSATQ